MHNALVIIIDTSNKFVIECTCANSLRLCNFCMHKIISFSSTTDPRVMDKSSETVLHWACKSKKENDEMVKLLLGK